MKTIDLGILDRLEIIAVDTKKRFEYDKHSGEWLWRDSDTEDMAEWHGPFATRLDALKDAVEPYIADEAESIAFTT